MLGSPQKRGKRQSKVVLGIAAKYNKVLQAPAFLLELAFIRATFLAH